MLQGTAHLAAGFEAGYIGTDDMRRSIFSVVILTALAAVAAPAAAPQSPTSFPWCMKGARGGTSCYFYSYQDCAATVSGLGGWCIRNPYYRGPNRQ
jgi:hypothetical protein